MSTTQQELEAEKQRANDLARQLEALKKDKTVVAEIVNKSSSAGERTIGLKKNQAANVSPIAHFSVSNGVGDPEVPQSICWAMKKETMIPPLSTLEDQAVVYINQHHIVFLPHQYDSKTIALCRKAYEPWFELDHQLPQSKLFACVYKLGNLVSTICAEDDESKRYITQDVIKFVAQVLIRITGEGMYRVGREYVLAKVQRWAHGVEAGVAWDDNPLSKFDEGLWSSSIGAAGGRDKLDCLFRSELEGEFLTSWGALINIAISSGALDKLRRVVQEDRKIGGDVLGGKKPEGDLPPSLNYRLPSSGAHRYSSTASSGGHGDGGGGGHGKENRQPQYQKPSFQSGQQKSAGAGVGNKIKCRICEDPGHVYRNCPKIHPSVSVNDDGQLVHSYDDGDKTFLCRNNFSKSCKFGSACHNSHGCALCGQKGCDGRCKSQ
ncbi:hypothetical protein JCM11251_002798 [Rhodosporidiobolus azoricus]